MPESFWQPYQKLLGEQGDLQQFRTERYLHLIRNFHRYSWLLLFLFGASPAACKCFARDRQHGLDELDAGTLFLPHATCLRMGQLGYRSDAQKSLFVCYNELESYVECLRGAIHTPYAQYEDIGQQRNGEYLQINTNLLQLENEFYSTIRPKPRLESGERPLDALVNRGIDYIEVRALDLNPYLPLGIDTEQIRFLDTFLLHCLLSESPECHKAEFFEVASNIAKVVEHGRDPELMLDEDSKPRAMRDWAGTLLTDLEHSAALLDHLHDSDEYGRSLAAQQAKLADPDLTPSGRMLKEMQTSQLSFFNFAMQQSRNHSAQFRQDGLDEHYLAELRKAGSESLSRQKEVEAADSMSFDDFLRDYNSR